jgi:AP-1 complex subunit mu
MLRAEFRLPSVTDEEAAPERKAPIRVKFEIPYFTVSGIQVCCIKMVFVYSKYYLAIFFQY